MARLQHLHLEEMGSKIRKSGGQSICVGHPAPRSTILRGHQMASTSSLEAWTMLHEYIMLKRVGHDDQNPKTKLT